MSAVADSWEIALAKDMKHATCDSDWFTAASNIGGSYIVSCDLLIQSV